MDISPHSGGADGFLSPHQPESGGEVFEKCPPASRRSGGKVFCLSPHRWGDMKTHVPPQSSGGDGKSNVSPPTWGVNKIFFGLSPRLWGDIWMDWDIVWGDRTNVWGESISSAPPAGRTLGGQFFSGGIIFYSEGADEISCPPPQSCGGKCPSMGKPWQPLYHKMVLQ